MDKKKINDLVYIVGIVCVLIAISKIIPTWIFVLAAVVCGIYIYLEKADDKSNMQ